MICHYLIVAEDWQSFTTAYLLEVVRLWCLIGTWSNNLFYIRDCFVLICWVKLWLDRLLAEDKVIYITYLHRKVTTFVEQLLFFIFTSFMLLLLLVSFLDFCKNSFILILFFILDFLLFYSLFEINQLPNGRPWGSRVRSWSNTAVTLSLEDTVRVWILFNILFAELALLQLILSLV